MSWNFKTRGQRFTARIVGVLSADLTWPNDFPGFPSSIGDDQVVEIDAIKMVLTTVLAAGNRRPRIRLNDDQFFKTVEWHAGVTTPALTNGAIYQWSKGGGGGADSLQGGVARTMLPSGLWMLLSVLSIDIIGAQAGDGFDEIIVSGQFVG